MDNTEQIKNLDARMKELEDKIDTLAEVMGEIKEELKKIGRGLYGDEDNATPGLIARQAKDESRLRDLELKVNILEKAIKEKDLKKKTTNELVEKLKKWSIVIGVMYMIGKEILGLDTLVGLLFK